jgi:hypothetical protein
VGILKNSPQFCCTQTPVFSPLPNGDDRKSVPLTTGRLNGIALDADKNIGLVFLCQLNTASKICLLFIAEHSGHLLWSL